MEFTARLADNRIAGWILCYSEYYVDVTAQQLDSVIAPWMECVTVNFIWKLLHSKWTFLLQVEWSVLQWKLFGIYSTARGQFNCSLNGVCYSEFYVEGTTQQVVSGIAGWLECVTLSIMWMVVHSMFTV